MKKIIVVVLLSTLVAQAKSQSIFVDKELRKGLYRTFQEFISNNPSLPLNESEVVFEEDTEILLDNVKGFLIYEGTEVKLPVFRFKNKKTNKREKTSTLWGYCDGTKVFINSYTHIPRHFFVELLLVGRYCYFMQVGDPSNFQPAGSPNFSVVNTYETVDEYIINVNNGKIFKLDRKLLKQILESDKELLEEFENDKAIKKKFLIEYIKKYNDRHRDEIKALKELED